jgi:sensor domain CHASE-containing protein
MPPILLTNALPEVIIAIILVVAVVVAWKRIETGGGQAKM